MALARLGLSGMAEKLASRQRDLWSHGFLLYFWPGMAGSRTSGKFLENDWI